jgi:hypothetical protein
VQIWVTDFSCGPTCGCELLEEIYFFLLNLPPAPRTSQASFFAISCGTGLFFVPFYSEDVILLGSQLCSGIPIVLLVLDGPQFLASISCTPLHSAVKRNMITHWGWKILCEIFLLIAQLMVPQHFGFLRFFYLFVCFWWFWGLNSGCHTY